uniref:FAD-binding FR-type domain-containing protein n=1 Tax=Rhodosorus marinus TaxID=101924 RepID=A0A7S3AAD9_9RHOD|mmetsp:Transcript_9099/g.40003  ORF Transcript_9099/g.40003 Transcript_9099/m.40003 type:complete len:566 (+) Transcript_9099:297-1994(+)
MQVATGYVFHSGELALQKRDGTAETASRFNSYIKTEIDVVLGRNDFLHELRTVYLSTSDENGNLWVSEISGEPGFLHAQDPKTMTVKMSKAMVVPGDPVVENFQRSKDPRVGMISLSFEKTRRYRTNGTLSAFSRDGDLVVSVEEAFGNCPKYIQHRKFVGRRAKMGTETLSGKQLSPEAMAQIRNCNTFFLGTINKNGNSDVSHRGGYGGFIQAKSPREIEWPEYGGNGMFMSLGNLMNDRRASLLFVDHEKSGDILQVTGEAECEWGRTDVEGTGRVIKFKVKEYKLHLCASPYEWMFVEYSKYNVAHDRGKLMKAKSELFPLSVKLAQVDSANKSGSVRKMTFWGSTNIPFKPGQYISFNLKHPTGTLNRTWTLTRPPRNEGGDFQFEICVKRLENGTASTWMHDIDVLTYHEVSAIGGDLSPFIGLDELPKEILLVSAGIGITPAISILRGLEGQKDITVRFFHSERHEEDRCFADELLNAAERNENLRVILTVTDPEEPLEDGRIRGRINKGLLDRNMNFERSDCHAYLCGPGEFMSDVSCSLIELGIPSAQIHTEDFSF